MKAKDYIIIGGAIALFYLYQRNKSKKLSASTEAETQEEAISSGGGGMMGGGMPNFPPIVSGGTPIVSSSVVTGTKGGTASGGEAIFTGATPIRNTSSLSSLATPIEVAIQQGGVSTNPQPAILPPPPLSTEGALSSGGVVPVTRNVLTLASTEA